MWEMVTDIVSVLVLVVIYCIYHRNELYGGIDDSQA
jgi:ABC-type cobalt transport system substrate-binding protein